MTVSEDYSGEPGRVWVEVKRAQIVQEIERVACDIHSICRRVLTRERRYIDVADDGEHWGNLTEFREDILGADVASVEDHVRAAQSCHRVGMHSSMGIGDDADDQF